MIIHTLNKNSMRVSKKNYEEYIQELLKPEKDPTLYEIDPRRKSPPPVPKSDKKVEFPQNKEMSSEDLDKLNKIKIEAEEAEKRLKQLKDDEKHLQQDFHIHGAQSIESMNSSEIDNASDSGRVDFAKNIADLLFDIRERKEDDVTEFDDDPLKWTKFKAQYLVSVHNKHIPNLQKLAILTKKITGKIGKNILHGIEYDPDNYQAAWEAIVRQFHHQAQLVRIELQEFLKINNSRSTDLREGNKGARIRELYNKTKRLATNLKSIFKQDGIENEKDIFSTSYNAMIVFTIENALDPVTKLAWGTTRKGSKLVPDHKELLEFLEARASNIEYYASAGQEKIKSKIENKNSPKQAEHIQTLIVRSSNAPRAAARRNGNKKQEAKISFATKSCKLCTGNHFLHDCTKFKKMHINDKWNWVLKSKICANCFKHDYNKESPCRQPPCKKCKANHNELLHRNAVTKKQKPKQALNAAAQFHQSLTPTVILMVQTKNGQSIGLRAMIDTGSEASFITKRACQILQLPMRNTVIALQGIGGKHKKAKGLSE